MNNNLIQLVNEMMQGSIRALARLITRVENRDEGWIDVMKMIYPKTGRAKIIGITGSPGTGKSTLTNQIAHQLAQKGNSIGIVAVDPSSPFSGGAILGDRLRMKNVSDLSGVYVRSLATRGALGGLSQGAGDVVKILDAFGKDFIIIETVGVGQDEVEIIKTSDIVLVVCVPGQGDAIQAIKAGIMEIADIFVVNKADIDGADQVVSDIEGMLSLDVDTDDFIPPIVKTTALEGEGIPELVDTILDQLESSREKCSWQEQKTRDELVGLLVREVSDIIQRRWKRDGSLDLAVKQIVAREKDPYSVIQEVIEPLSPLL